MGLSDVLKTASELVLPKKHTTAVILAAGSGERFSAGSGGASEKKQFVSVLGRPVLLRTAEAFEKCELISEIIVVSSSDEIEHCRELLENKISKLRCVIAGGDTRQKSAMAAIEAVYPKTDYIAIHDAARCLITPKQITDTVCAAYRNGAAAAAERAVDTVKYATADECIESTIDRDHVWLVKTPQVFKANMYRVAAYSAFKDGVTVTDDCMAAERVGFKVKLVDCGHENIKLTYAVDRIIAEAILRCREAESGGDK